RRIFKIASKNPKATGELLLSLLERRLDNVLFRANFAKSRLHARQLINHGKIRLNNKKVSTASILVNEKDVISPKLNFKDNIEILAPCDFDWLKINKTAKTIEVKKLPIRLDAPAEINEQLIVEFYNR
ncbi:MAG: small subunit ribosomal protein S4, partial [Candidatus Berkelbacteria bacterium Licking1014_85]